MGTVRPAAVAGLFYPGEARTLRTSVEDYLSQAGAPAGPVPKAIIAPHAGYVYSGQIAASAYARILPAAERISRVILVGPCHRVAVRGLAVSSAASFATPLGDVPLDRPLIDRLTDLPQVSSFDATHAQEHSLEVHLPFLQVILGTFTLVPLVAGDAGAEEVAEVLEMAWGGPETLIVVSSDLSHYEDYESAKRLDSATREAIEEMEPARIGYEQACGRIPISGLLTLARRRGLEVATVDLRNSGDTAGPRDQVVGYGSWVFIEKGESEESGEHAKAAPGRRHIERYGATLLHVAAASIEFGIAHGRAAPIHEADYPAELRAPGASFVTLKRKGELRGCIGSSEAKRPLIVDVAENAYAAAFDDPRFPGLMRSDVAGLDLSVAILATPVPVQFTDEESLLRQLTPEIDGLIIEDAGRRALFLPAVWRTLPDPKQFLNHLKQKAGLPADHRSKDLQAWRFTATEIRSADLDDPASLWGFTRDTP